MSAVVSSVEFARDFYFLPYPPLYFTNNFKMSICYFLSQQKLFQNKYLLWYAFNGILDNIIISHSFSLFALN